MAYFSEHHCTHPCRILVEALDRPRIDCCGVRSGWKKARYWEEVKRRRRKKAGRIRERPPFVKKYQSSPMFCCFINPKKGSCPRILQQRMFFAGTHPAPTLNLKQKRSAHPLSYRRRSQSDPLRPPSVPAFGERRDRSGSTELDQTLHEWMSSYMVLYLLIILL